MLCLTLSKTLILANVLYTISSVAFVYHIALEQSRNIYH